METEWGSSFEGKDQWLQQVPTCKHEFDLSFLLMFPNAFIDDVILLASNEALAEGAKKITKGEFLHWLGLWFLMGTVKGCKH